VHVLLGREALIVKRFEQCSARVAKRRQALDPGSAIAHGAAHRRRRRAAAAARPATAAASPQPNAPPPLLLGAVTVRLAEAAVTLPPAGAVVKAFAASVLV
jgi:hypothetical protein